MDQAGLSLDLLISLSVLIMTAAQRAPLCLRNWTVSAWWGGTRMVPIFSHDFQFPLQLPWYSLLFAVNAFILYRFSHWVSPVCRLASCRRMWKPEVNAQCYFWQTRRPVSPGIRFCALHPVPHRARITGMFGYTKLLCRWQICPQVSVLGQQAPYWVIDATSCCSWSTLKFPCRTDGVSVLQLRAGREGLSRHLCECPNASTSRQRVDALHTEDIRVIQWRRKLPFHQGVEICEQISPQSLGILQRWFSVLGAPAFMTSVNNLWTIDLCPWPAFPIKGHTKRKKKCYFYYKLLPCHWRPKAGLKNWFFQEVAQ